MVSAEDITAAVNRYLELVATGTADDIVELYADDATVEDPVGGEVHIGRHAIQAFYKNIEGAERTTELHELRVAGHEAAFFFAITVDAGGHKVRIELVQTSATVTAPIFWRAIRIADQLPTLQELFEDTG